VWPLCVFALPFEDIVFVCTDDNVLRRELEGHTLRSGFMWVRIADEKREQKDIPAKSKIHKVGHLFLIPLPHACFPESGWRA
jgi:hypothetical protein